METSIEFYVYMEGVIYIIGIVLLFMLIREVAIELFKED
jgi:hypothetical protein